MFIKYFKFISIVFVLVLGMMLVEMTFSPDLVSANSGKGSQNNSGVNENKITPLSETEKTNLLDAIQEEYGAYNLYSTIILKFGQEEPFVNIVQAEQQHINTLIKQAVRLGVSYSANNSIVDVTKIETLQDAYAAGVAAEIADASLYDELKKVTSNQSLLKVYNNLQKASLEKHLPAFQSFLN